MEINVMVETNDMKKLRKEKGIINKRLLELDNEKKELIKKTRVLSEKERSLTYIVAKNEWCTRNKVDTTIEFGIINIDEEDEDEDENGYLCNSYEFTLDGITIGVYILYNRETDDQKLQLYIVDTEVTIEDLPEKCKIAVEAIIDDEPDFYNT
jgi:hypothetical protein